MKIFNLLIIGVLSIANARAIGIDLTIIDSASKNEVIISQENFEKLSKSTITTSTSWTERSDFEGVKVQDLLAISGFKGNNLRFYALNDYWIDIPIDDVRDFDILLANKINGKKMSVRDFGPYFVVYPLDTHAEQLNKPMYHARFIWQVYKIEVKQN